MVTSKNIYIVLIAFFLTAYHFSCHIQEDSNSIASPSPILTPVVPLSFCNADSVALEQNRLIIAKALSLALAKNGTGFQTAFINKCYYNQLTRIVGDKEFLINLNWNTFYWGEWSLEQILVDTKLPGIEECITYVKSNDPLLSIMLHSPSAFYMNDIVPSQINILMPKVYLDAEEDATQLTYYINGIPIITNTQEPNEFVWVIKSSETVTACSKTAPHIIWNDCGYTVEDVYDYTGTDIINYKVGETNNYILVTTFVDKSLDGTTEVRSGCGLPCDRDCCEGNERTYAVKMVNMSQWEPWHRGEAELSLYINYLNGSKNQGNGAGMVYERRYNNVVNNSGRIVVDVRSVWPGPQTPDENNFGKEQNFTQFGWVERDFGDIAEISLSGKFKIGGILDLAESTIKFPIKDGDDHINPINGDKMTGTEVGYCKKFEYDNKPHGDFFFWVHETQCN